MNRKTIAFILTTNIVTLLIVAWMVWPLAGRAATESPAAGAPSLVSYQGYLANDGGAPFSGNMHLRFGIYPASDTPPNDYLWQEDHPTVLVMDGYFQAMLGSQGTPLTAGVFDGAERWLQVTIVNGSSYTDLPRQRIAAAPFALQSQQASNADTLDNHDSTYFALAVHTHAWSDLTGEPVAWGCRLYQSQDRAFTTLPYTLSWSDAIHDTANCWTVEDRIDITANGYYLAGANVAFSSDAADAGKRVNLSIARMNSGGALQEYLAAQTIFTQPGVVNYLNVEAAMFYADAGDYLLIQIGGNTTGPITLLGATTQHPHYQSAWLARLP
jgi:hypothetical protein